VAARLNDDLRAYAPELIWIELANACYVVLADALDAILVTADRRLADAASRAELIA
jgi:predicted nucleic acid-binding protein